MAGSEAPGSRVEHVTATGIRFIGPKAASLASRSESAVAPGRDEDTLFVARCQVRRRLGTGSALNIVLQELSAAVLEGWPGAPPLTRDRSVRRPAARFEGLVWDVEGDAGAWRGELLWRRPHPVIAGAPCTTHVILSELDANVTLLVRVTADKGLASVRGMVGAGQARPIFLSAMSRTLRMFHDGLEAAAHPLPDDAIAGFVRDVLLSDTREHPVALLAPQEDGAFVVPPPEIAADLIGIAHVYFMERHAATFRLSDELGDRRLSAYWGALRVYLPGFSCGDRPEEHPLLVRDRLVDPVMRADLYGSLGRFARRRIAWPERTAPAEAPRTRGGAPVTMP
ncbi:MAG: hypothetical protein HUU26_13310 [Gemmatimonadaceae bacterium]|nr:hypothetical protein [Gemmatimonadaceae bacterium]